MADLDDLDRAAIKRSQRAAKRLMNAADGDFVTALATTMAGSAAMVFHAFGQSAAFLEILQVVAEHRESGCDHGAECTLWDGVKAKVADIFEAGGDDGDDDYDLETVMEMIYTVVQLADASPDRVKDLFAENT